MRMKPYLQVSQFYRREEIIRRSRFITTLVPFDSEQEAQMLLKEIAGEYSDATHNCYAYISDINSAQMRYSDDGEPQGTAGTPILEVLKKRNVCKTLTVVTRYFGGIKLGANGLVGAYSSCVAQSLDAAPLRLYLQSIEGMVTLDYSVMGKVSELIESYGGRITSRDYSDNVNLKFIVPEENCSSLNARITDITLGRANIITTDNKYADYDCSHGGKI